MLMWYFVAINSHNSGIKCTNLVAYLLFYLHFLHINVHYSSVWFCSHVQVLYKLILAVMIAFNALILASGKGTWPVKN